jgi:uncharacterized protein (TIGR03089 family)
VPRPNDTPTDLLHALATSDPTRPRLTWYDEAPGPTFGERIELSGRVLATWVAKAANLLEEEFEVGPGSVVAVDLPVHWRAAYWLFAAWSVGASVETGICRNRPDVVVTDDPEVWPAPQVVAVSLPALVRAWAGPPLVAGSIDEARELASYGDVFAPSEQPAPDALALTTPERSWTFEELVPAARRAAGVNGLGTRPRVLTSNGAQDAVACWLAPWVLDGSMVLVRTDPNRRDDAASAARAESELVTDRL